MHFFKILQRLTCERGTQVGSDRVKVSKFGLLITELDMQLIGTENQKLEKFEKFLDPGYVRARRL